MFWWSLDGRAAPQAVHRLQGTCPRSQLASPACRQLPALCLAPCSPAALCISQARLKVFHKCLSILERQRKGDRVKLKINKVLRPITAVSDPIRHLVSWNEKMFSLQLKHAPKKRAAGWGGWRTAEGLWHTVFVFPILTLLICLAYVVIPSVFYILSYWPELFSSEIQELHNLTGLDRKCKGVLKKRKGMWLLNLIRCILSVLYIHSVRTLTLLLTAPLLQHPPILVQVHASFSSLWIQMRSVQGWELSICAAMHVLHRKIIVNNLAPCGGLTREPLLLSQWPESFPVWEAMGWRAEKWHGTILFSPFLWLCCLDFMNQVFKGNWKCVFQVSDLFPL